MKRSDRETCVYCKGNGYFQLITGGSTTCPACQGEGKDYSEDAVLVTE
jgi:DnaJ-class molecular chaperone